MFRQTEQLFKNNSGLAMVDDAADRLSEVFEDQWCCGELD